MTLAIGLLTRVLNICLEKEGTLYSACEMGFFEEVIFKEKNIDKFIKIIDAKAIKVSTISPFNCDDIIREELNKITSKMI